MEEVFSYEIMGTHWKVTIYETFSLESKSRINQMIDSRLKEFDDLYSRFKSTSLISKLSETTGLVKVPKDLTAILRIYKECYYPSGKKFTPCIGSLLEDLGYDKEYSFVKKDSMRAVPDFDSAVHIVDDEHILLNEKVLLDIGAVGKGYMVDLIATALKELGYKHFLVDGSGDVYYQSPGSPIAVGLEHPHDDTKVIGSMEMTKGAMCSSATNRRSWEGYSHYVDPSSSTSPKDIVATWVMTDTAALADALSSMLFFVAPEALSSFSFEYCVMNYENKIKKSPGFQATFF